MERIIKCVSIVIHNVKVGSKILDIGCGSGLFGEILAKKGYKVYGIDVLPCKDECLRKGYIDVKESIDVNYGIPYNDEFFDLVFCGEIIEHIWDTTFFLCEVNRVLLNDGYILLTTPNLATIANLPRLILGNSFIL
jgi:2-polyprenyl-3-methyl-5-hydroxy-6-metoxy-1,4-benzoquinol methylase